MRRLPPSQSRPVAVGLVVLLALLIQCAHPTNIAAGPEAMDGLLATGYAVANLSETDSATVRLRRFLQDGTSDSTVLDVAACSVAPYTLDNEWLIPAVSLEDGGAAGVLSASLGAVGRAHWTKSRGEIYTNSSTVSSDFVIPLAVKNLGGQTSVISVVHPGRGGEAEVEFVFREMGHSSPIQTLHREIGPGGCWSIALDLIGGDSDLPDGFIGWIDVSSDVPIGLTSTVDVQTSDTAVFSVEASAKDAATSSSLYAPAISSHQDASSAIALVNPQGTGVLVEVEYRGQWGSCSGETYTQSAVVPPFTSVVFDQGAAEMPVTGRSPLPDGCTASATIRAGYWVEAVVNTTGQGWPPTWAGAYPAIRESATSEKVLVPIWMASLDGDYGTGIAVMNVGSDKATASISFYDNLGTRIQGCGSACGPIAIAPGGTHSWESNELLSADGASYLPTGYGWARVEADARLAVVAGISSEHVRADPVMQGDFGAYAGLPCGREPVAEAALAFPGLEVPCPHDCPKPTFFATSQPTAVATSSPTMQHEPTLTPHTPAPSATSTVYDPGPSATPSPTATATPTSSPTSSPSPAPSPTIAATPTPRGYGRVCAFILNRVPRVAIDWALANPEKVYGWDQLAFPGRPPSPVNIRKRMLSIRNVGMPYDAWFNPLVYKAGCP